MENYAAALDEVLRVKPSAAKGKYLRKITIATTMGPGVPVDPTAPAACWVKKRPDPVPSFRDEASRCAGRLRSLCRPVWLVWDGKHGGGARPPRREGST